MFIQHIDHTVISYYVLLTIFLCKRQLDRVMNSTVQYSTVKDNFQVDYYLTIPSFRKCIHFKETSLNENKLSLLLKKTEAFFN